MTGAIIGVALVILASIIEGVSQTFFKKSALVAVGKQRWVAGGVLSPFRKARERRPGNARMSSPFKRGLDRVRTCLAGS